MAVRTLAGWLFAAVLLRWTVSLQSYSGLGSPPRFGDYEAQRHWMELAINLPPTHWYSNSSHNDLSYWGLDYPPVSGYQSWLCGKYVQLFEPEAVELGASHGYESPSSKRLLRHTVLASDLLVMLPAALASAATFGRGNSRRSLTLLVALLFCPAAILIDHGHFQYNCIQLGLAAGAAAAAVSDRAVLSAVLFSLSLNHKQMGLYFAPAFFAYLLGKRLQQRTLAGKVRGIAALGVATIATFAVIWAPWLHVSGQRAWLGVMHRVFPTQRGLYEDYVANWWCTSSRLIKWTRLISQHGLVQLCGATTLLAVAPAMATQVARPTARGFLLCLANSATAFYLFSYHVHEKSILLPLLPLSMLFGAEHPQLLCWFNLIATFSMMPLLQKDGLSLATMGTLACCHAAIQLASSRALANADATRRKANTSMLRFAWQELVFGLSLAGCATILAASALLPPPPNLPFLYDAIITTFSFLHFVALFAYTYKLQMEEYCNAKQP